MKKLLCLMLTLALLAPAFAFAETDEERIAALEERVAKLETLVESLTGKTLEAEQEVESPAPVDEGSVETLSVGDAFTLSDGVKLTVTDYELTNYFSYYAPQSSYSNYFGFSQFFGRSGGYGQRTIRSGNDNVYLALKIRLENSTQQDISVGDAMKALARCDGEPIEPEQSFLYYNRNYDGYIAGETTLQLGPRSSVDGILLFVMPSSASDETKALTVTFTGSDAAVRYSLRGGDTGLLMDQFGDGEKN